MSLSAVKCSVGSSGEKVYCSFIEIYGINLISSQLIEAETPCRYFGCALRKLSQVIWTRAGSYRLPNVD